MKRVFLLFSLLVTANLFQVAAKQASEIEKIYYVSPIGLDTNEGTEANPFKTIGKALSLITDATPTKIYLTPNATFTLGGTVTIGKVTSYHINVALIGENTTIQANVLPYVAEYRLFRIGEGGFGNCKLKGLILKNGRISDFNPGGAIFFPGNRLEIENCSFMNNYAGSGGGAIASRGKVVIIKDSYFYENKSGSGSHGAAIMQTGTKADSGNCIEIYNTTFEENGFSDKTNSFPLSGYGSCFSNNEPTSSGANRGKVDDMKVSNCTFINNNNTATTDPAVSAAIHLDSNMNGVTAHIINNSFYTNKNYINGNAMLRIEQADNNVLLINNVMVGTRHGVVVVKPLAERLPIIAYNNTIISHHPLSSNATAEEFSTSKNNQVEGYIINPAKLPTEEDIANLENAIASLSLSIDRNKKYPYLAITNASSTLVDSGMDSHIVGNAELIATTDILGTARPKGTHNDRGCFELDGTVSISQNEYKDIMQINQLSDGIEILNNSDKSFHLSIWKVDGTQILSENITDKLLINKGDLPCGFLLCVFQNQHIKISQKIIL